MQVTALTLQYCRHNESTTVTTMQVQEIEEKEMRHRKSDLPKIEVRLILIEPPPTTPHIPHPTPTHLTTLFINHNHRPPHLTPPITHHTTLPHLSSVKIISSSIMFVLIFFL